MTKEGYTKIVIKFHDPWISVVVLWCGQFGDTCIQKMPNYIKIYSTSGHRTNWIMMSKE